MKLLNGLALDAPPSCSALMLKEHIAVNGLLAVADLMLIQNGQEMCDSKVVDADATTSVIYALLRSKCSSNPSPTVQLTVKFGSNKYNINVDVYSKIFSIKRTIEKLVKVNSNSMRLMMNGCIMKDSYLLGDYILYAANKAQSASAEFVVYVTKVFDVKKEVDVSVHFTNGCKDKPLTFSYSISEPIARMRDVLFTRFMLPKSLMLVLTLRCSSGKVIKLDPTKRLVDYGIGSPSSISNKVNIYMYKEDDDDMLDDVSFDEEIKLLKATLGARKVGSSCSWAANSTVTKSVRTENNDNKENVPAQAQAQPTTPKTKSGFKRGFLCSNNKDNTKKGK